jgi:hypothetical protein
MARRDRLDDLIAGTLRDEVSSVRFNGRMKAAVRASVEERRVSRVQGFDPQILLRRLALAATATAAAVMLAGATLVFVAGGSRNPTTFRVSNLPGAAVIYNQER